MADKYTSTGNSQVGSRIGLNTGLGGLLKISEKLDIGMELLYSQNAIYINLEQLPNIELERIRLHYVEIPLQVVFNPLQRRKNSLPGSVVRLKWIGGLSVARLFHHNTTAVNEQELIEQVSFSRPTAFLLHLGTAVSLSEKLALNAKVSASAYGDWTFSFRLFRYF